MKQIIQSYKTGEMILEEVTVPQAAAGAVLVETAAPLVSAGTEKMLVDRARKSLVGKARRRPDLVKKVIDKAKREGLASTIQKVRSMLDNPSPLGYSCAGVVREVGEGVDELQPGDWFKLYNGDGSIGLNGSNGRIGW
jgi:NADPH:quinone reductase-like Zn-dependent oxidoreductase